jgi:hypothetical protein
MAMRSVFAYNNLDDTADLNIHFKTLFGRGVVSGGEILPVAGTSNITVNPFYASSADGMIVWDTAFRTLACLPGIVNVIVLRAVYNAPAAPTLSFEVMTVNNYNSDPQKANLIVFGRIDMTGATTTSLSQVSYATRDHVTKIAHDPFLGVYEDTSTFFSAWPTAVPVKQKPNDFALVVGGTNGKPSFYYWSTAWIEFGNYEQLQSEFADHTSGVVGGGTTVHTTADEKAALAGTSGVPGAGNRFVTEGDNTRVLAANQKAAIDYAKAGGPLSDTNPLIGDGLPVTVAKLISYTITTEQDFINIFRADQGSGTPFFGAPVFVGKLGLDTTHANRSSSRQYFKVEDEKFNGYMDEDGPLYVIDVQDAAGSGSFNAAASTDVTSIGYWAPSAGTSALRIKFNRTIATGKTIFLRYNGLGKVSQLAPSGPYSPPSTGFRAGVEAYQEIHTQLVTTQYITTQHVGTGLFANGSSVAPSIAFDSNADTGLYYIGDTTDAGVHSAIGVAIDGETVLQIARRQSGGSGALDPNEMPLMIEQNFDGTSTIYRIYNYNAQSRYRARGIEFGAANYTAPYTPYLRIGATDDLGTFGVICYKSLVMAGGSRIIADNGTEVAPSIVFDGDRDTGFYYLAAKTTFGSSYYNLVGLSLNGRTAFAFATNTPTTSLTGDMNGVLIFEQNTQGGNVECRQLISSGSSSIFTGLSHAFGATSYANDADIWLRVGTAWTEAYGRLWTKEGLYIGGNARDDENLRITATANSWSLMLRGAASLTYGTGQLSVAGGAVFTGPVVAPVGSETAPAFAFAGALNTGFYYVGTMSTAGVKTRSAVGVSIDGVATVVFGRNEANPGTLAPTEVPMLIEQSISGMFVETRFCQMDRTTGGAGSSGSAMSFGFGDYTNDYIPWITLDSNAAAANAVLIHQSTRFEKSVIFNDTTSFTGRISSVAGVTTSTASNATLTAYALTAAGNTGLHGSSGKIGLSLVGQNIFYADASSTAVYRNGSIFLFANATDIAFSLPLTVIGGISSTANTYAGGNSTVVGTLTVGGASVFDAATYSGTVIFNGHVTFNSTATLPPINLVDLNDVTWLTGTTLETYFTELGLNPAVPPTYEAVSGLNIKNVFDALGQTQAARVQSALCLSSSVNVLSVAAMQAYQTLAFYNAFNDLLGGKPLLAYCSENNRQYQLTPVRDPLTGLIEGAVWLSVDYEISRIEATSSLLTTPTLPVNPANTGDWSSLGQFPYIQAYAYANGNGEIRVPFSCQEIDMVMSLDESVQTILPERAGIDVARSNLLFRLAWVAGNSIDFYWNGRIIASSVSPDTVSPQASAVWTLRFDGNGIQVPQHSVYGRLLPIGHTMPGFVLCAARASAIGAETGLISARFGVRASMKFRERLPYDYGNVIISL